MPEQIKTILKEKFGFAEFRPLQEEIVNDVLVGGNRFVVLPTGGGKSLAYLLPAFFLEGLTLVVSPLISLMEDQLKRAEELGLRAAIWLNEICFKDLQVVFVSPEKLFSWGVMAQVSELVVDHFVIDEAHSVSGWGSSFRPFYGLLKEVINLVNPRAISLFSATVRKSLKLEIEENLGLQNVHYFNGGFDRDNLSFHKINCAVPEIFVSQLLNKLSGKAIVYCGSRKKVEFVALFLLQKGFQVAPYHAGMKREIRADLQGRFKRGDFSVLCATSAFGMGVDIPNIRTVIHLQVPASLEDYYQEVGRAGRDGEKALALLLVKPGWEKSQISESLAKFTFRRQSQLPQIPCGENEFLGKLDEILAGLYEIKSLYAFLLYYEIFIRIVDKSQVVVKPVVGWQSKLKVACRIEMKKQVLAKSWVKRFVKKSTCNRATLLGFFQEKVKLCGGCDYCGSEYSLLLQTIKINTKKTVKVLNSLRRYPLSEQRKIITQSKIVSREKIGLEMAQRFFRKTV